ncbi:MAG: tRNA guanosine(34) transglycosylase Tgt [Candidatus Calescibacterium sp.]|nr:tRNA guanosine(34) transglycosylase Tgt [Candidatus Calescibacterium sp.]
MQNYTSNTQKQKNNFFELLYINNNLRIGKLRNSIGQELLTPAFIPVATNASIKALDSIKVKELGINGIFVNTYHMHLTPGEDIVQELGGLHKFMNYNGLIFTDSGGFQAFSLGQAITDGVGKIVSIFSKEGRKKQISQEKLAEVTDEYIIFKSHIDGRILKLTPENSILIQHKLGSDILMVLDECTSPLASYEYTKSSMERSSKWALRCLDFFKKHNKGNQYLYGIIQGGYHYDLRIKSAEFICSLDFDGIAIGGSLGTSRDNIAEILSWIIDYIPQEKPRHLLGIGSIPEIFTAIENGIDTFDCVIPTRYARTGTVFVNEPPNFIRDITAKHYKNIESKKYDLPIEQDCECYTCKNYTVAYLNHLFYVGEISVMTLLTIHNLNFYDKLLKKIRQAILENKYFEFKQHFFKSENTLYN